MTGLSLGVASLLIGLVGFAVTLWQLHQVKDAASAQKIAINSLKIRLAHLDIIQECTKAESSLNKIKYHLLEKREEVPLSVFDELATAFVNISEGFPGLATDLRDILRTTILDINKMSEGASKMKFDSSSSAKQAAVIRNYHGIIVKIRAGIHEDQEQ